MALFETWVVTASGRARELLVQLGAASGAPKTHRSELTVVRAKHRRGDRHQPGVRQQCRRRVRVFSGERQRYLDMTSSPSVRSPRSKCEYIAARREEHGVLYCLGKAIPARFRTAACTCPCAAHGAPPRRRSMVATSRRASQPRRSRARASDSARQKTPAARPPPSAGIPPRSPQGPTLAAHLRPCQRQWTGAAVQTGVRASCAAVRLRGDRSAAAARVSCRGGARPCSTAGFHIFSKNVQRRFYKK